MINKGRVLVLAVVVALGVCAVAVNAEAKAGAKKAAGAKEVVWPADKLQFKEAGAPGVSRAVLWGDPDKGAYGAVTRFTKGTKNALHTHSHEIKIVVISGTFLYDSGSGENKLGPGSYLLEPGGVKHTSGAGADADCVFFQESSGAFDRKPAK